MSFDLPIGWKIVPLEDLCERVSVGHVGETSVFFTGTTNGVPLIRSQNVRPTKVDISDIKYITHEFHRQTKKSQLLGGDLLIVRVGQNRGDCAVLPHGLGEMNCANIVFARPDPRYSYYLGAYFNTPKGRDALLSVSSGSAQLVLNTKAVAKIEIPTPPPSTAQAIGAINCTIDNRISLLRETNTTLEAIAQTLFKSWFVDFDPVKAKAEGCLPEGMDEATAELFPSEFEESALGLIPKGWSISTIGETCEFQNGYAFKSNEMTKSKEDTYKVFKMGNIKKGGGLNRSGTKDYFPIGKSDNLERYLLKKGDLLMCMTDMKNNVALLGHTALMDIDNEFLLNQRVGMLRSKDASIVNCSDLHLKPLRTAFNAI